MLKNLKTALFQTFSTWHRILSAFTALYWPSTAFYWPSTTKYQPVPPYNDPVPSWINHYRLILIQCHQVPTSRATYWPSTIMYQPVSPSSDPVPPSTEQYRLLLNQYHHISTSTAPYWPSTTKYQSIPTYTDPVPSYINQYCLLLTQYHQVSTSTNLYCCWLGITDSCTVYPGSCQSFKRFNKNVYYNYPKLNSALCPPSSVVGLFWTMPKRTTIFFREHVPSIQPKWAIPYPIIIA